VFREFQNPHQLVNFSENIQIPVAWMPKTLVSGVLEYFLGVNRRRIAAEQMLDVLAVPLDTSISGIDTSTCQKPLYFTKVFEMIGHLELWNAFGWKSIRTCLRRHSTTSKTYPRIHSRPLRQPGPTSAVAMPQSVAMLNRLSIGPALEAESSVPLLAGCKHFVWVRQTYVWTTFVALADAQLTP
jgi:hypothetical protein